MKCMGRRRKGRFAYDNTWSYSALYGTLAETGDVLYLGLREGYRHTSYGTKEVLPGTIERVSKHFRQVRMRADSGYYSQALVKICEQREVEFFIVAKQHRNLMNAVREIQDSNWKSFAGLTGRRSGPTAAPAASEPETEDCDTAVQRSAGSSRHDVQAEKLEQSTPLRDQTDADRRQGRPAIVPGRRAAPVRLLRREQLKAQQRQVLRIAQGRGLIKDFKYGLGLAHIPTGWRWRRIKPTS